jgi:hypothetical protein
VGAELQSVAALLRVTRPQDLGIGLDAQNYGRAYQNLKVHCAWRFESLNRWIAYQSKKAILAQDCKRVGTAKLRVLNTPLDETGRKLPGGLDASINEKFLLHGTRPEHLLAVLQNGLNDRMSKSSGMFGGGVYLAERVEKIDQYCTPDAGFEHPELEDLHSALYCAGGNTHPREDIFYCFVVRAACGIPLSIRGLRAEANPDAPRIHCCDTDFKVFFSDDRRVLATVEDIAPPTHYSSLVVELGKAVKRFREFVVYDSQNLYIEYLVAFKREAEEKVL